MGKIFLTLLFTSVANGLIAQYLHYSDNSKKYSEGRTINKEAEPGKPGEEKVVYHEWPYCCPGIAGSIPILITYVPPELVLKLREKYQGRLYSIAGIKIDDKTHKYKLRICAGEEVEYAYADEEGNIITE
jgi:hypothetical protein